MFTMDSISFRGPRLVTADEVMVLCAFVEENKCSNILDIGTHGGFVAASLGRLQIESSNIENGKVTTLDYPRDILPSAKDVMKENNAVNVSIIEADDIIDGIKSLDDRFDFVFIDECHENMDILFDELEKKLVDGAVVIFHDIMCPTADDMITGNVFSSLIGWYDNQVFESVDDSDNINGLGVICWHKKEDPVVSEPEEELVHDPYPVEEKEEVVKPKRKRAPRKKAAPKKKVEVEEEASKKEEA